MNGMSNPVQKDDLTARLITRFKELLSDGVLSPGCRLPPERELAERFGVSRPSLRQALKVLEIMGVISQKVGDGTYLNRSASAILNEPMDFLVLLDSISHYELFETRLIVEPELAARAAERATLEDLGALRRSLAALERNGGNTSKIVEADLAFHEGIFRAAGNRVCHIMFHVIHQMLLTSIARTSQLVHVGHTMAFHKGIFEAVRKRDPEQAYQRMTEHLMDARAVLLRSNDRPAEAIEELIKPITPRLRQQRGALDK